MGVPVKHFGRIWMIRLATVLVIATLLPGLTPEEIRMRRVREVTRTRGLAAFWDFVIRDAAGMRLAERGLLLQNEIVATVLPAIERAFGAMAELPAPGLGAWRSRQAGPAIG